MNSNALISYPLAAVLTASALLSSCANQTVRKDVQDSYGVFYPVKLAGDSIEALGKGVSAVSSPKKWISPREKPFEQSTSPENEKLLAEKTVPFDLTKPFEIQTGASLGAAYHAAPLNSLLLNAESMAGYSFDWHLNPSLDDTAKAFPGGHIVIHPVALSKLSEAGIYFMCLHEAAHHILGHTSGAGMMAAMTTPWVTKDRETAADVFAAQRMSANGIPPATVIYGAMENFGSSPGDASHDAGPVRIAKIRAAMGWH